MDMFLFLGLLVVLMIFLLIGVVVIALFTAYIISKIIDKKF